VNFIGWPGHGFDGAVVPDADEFPLAPLELLPHAAAISASATTKHKLACTLHVRRFMTFSP
jgi:hypothetical protein